LPFISVIKQEQQRLAVQPENAQFMSIRQVSCGRRCCCRCYSAAAAATAAAAI